jgi:glutaconate CoA-transferase, subunit B
VTSAGPPAAIDLTAPPTSEERALVAAARALRPHDVCLVAAGAPMAVCEVACATRCPELVAHDESGASPTGPPMGATQLFRYWLQGRRATVALLGAAQVDRRGHLRTTAPEVAAHCARAVVLVRHAPDVLVESLDGTAVPAARAAAAPSLVVTDRCALRPDPATGELVVGSLHPGVTREDVAVATGWPVRIPADVATTPEPTAEELAALRDRAEPAAWPGDEVAWWLRATPSDRSAPGEGG